MASLNTGQLKSFKEKLPAQDSARIPFNLESANAGYLEWTLETNISKWPESLLEL